MLKHEVNFNLHLIHNTTFVTSDFFFNFEFYNIPCYEEFLYGRILFSSSNFI